MKKFRSKKTKNKFKIYLFLILIIYCVISYNVRFKNSNKDIIKYVFKSDIKYNYKNNIISNIYKGINKNIFNKPINILNTSFNNKVAVVSNISYMDNTPKVYIYNSHQGEKYSDLYMENSNIKCDVVLASNILKEKLEGLGIKTILEENDILGYMSNNGLNHGDSYIASRYFLNKVYEKYPNLDLYIDLHRDAIGYNESVINIGDKKYAKILFVIGLENPSYQNNLNVINKLNNIILNTYPSLTRGIMKKEGYGVNGVYNQDLDSNVILIEIGGDKNNMDEVSNTLDILANVIERYINEKEKL